MSQVWNKFSSSVVVVIGNDEFGNEVFGTGFVYAADEYYSYILTCRHIVEKIPFRNLRVDNKLAYQVYASDFEEQDYVILAVPGIQALYPPIHLEHQPIVPVLPCDATAIVARQGVKGKKELKPLEGTIISPGERVNDSMPGRRVSTWTFVSKTDEIYDGHSGGPVIVNGEVFGFVTATRPEPNAVEIIGIENVTFRHQGIRFKNRDREKKELADNHSALKLITAPTGYGKTMLLWELKRNSEPEWRTALCQVRQKDSLRDIAIALAGQINPSSSLPNGKDKEGEWLANQMFDVWSGNHKQIKGIALFIDLEDRGDLDFRDALLRKFIPDLSNTLSHLSGQKGLAVQSTGASSHFRIFVAGRHLGIDFSKIKSKVTHSFPPIFKCQDISLSPFEWQYVLATAEEFNLGDATIDVAAHIFFATGGHPGAVANILQSYDPKDETPPVQYFDILRKEIWQESILPAATKVLYGLSSSLWTNLGSGQEQESPLLTEAEGERFFETLILRYWDNRLIRRVLTDILNKNVPKGVEDDIRTRLKERGLLIRAGETNLWLNDANRRLLLVKIRNSEPAIFPTRCADAAKMCLEMLALRELKEPQLWARDFLLYSLLQHSQLVYTESGREKIRTTFQSDLSLLLSRLSKRKDPADIKQTILEKLDPSEKDCDWELIFTINFFLCQDSYSDDPINGILNFLRESINKKPKSGAKPARRKKARPKSQSRRK